MKFLSSFDCLIHLSRRSCSLSWSSIDRFPSLLILPSLDASLNLSWSMLRKTLSSLSIFLRIFFIFFAVFLSLSMVNLFLSEIILPF